MVAETTVRKGFLTDAEYVKLRDALPEYLRPLLATAYFTGTRLGELLAIEWEQVDWDRNSLRCTPTRRKAGTLGLFQSSKAWHAGWAHACALD